MVVGGILYRLDLLELLRSPMVIAISTLVFALPLWAADKFGPQHKSIESMTWKDAGLIGVAQAFALIPGASRSGVTMTAARMLGLDRIQSAKFSMLMAIPVIAAFAMISVLELVNGGGSNANMRDA